MTQKEEKAAVQVDRANVPHLITHADSRPDANATQAIIKAIGDLKTQLKDPKNKGIDFGAFTLKAVNGAFNNVWNSERGDQPITFFQSNATGGANDLGPFLPLGDFAMPNFSTTMAAPPGYQILFAPSKDKSVLAPPVDFEWVLDDAGSGNSHNISYYKIISPAGYVSLGMACTPGPKPDASRYWCVRSDLVRAVGGRVIWTDSGQRWTHHNGTISAPVPNIAMPEPQMLLAPQTFLSAEAWSPAFAVVLEQADLLKDTQTFDADAPKYDPSIYSGTVTQYGLKSAKIVPYTAVADPGLVDQSTTSPFYFVVAEPYWACIDVLSTPQGGDFQLTKSVGTAQQDSATFSRNTSLTVSANVGVSYDGVSGSMSASYTQAFQVTKSQTTSGSTEVQTQVTLTFPKQPQTWIWERKTQIAVFRYDTSQIAPVTYSLPDITFIPSS